MIIRRLIFNRMSCSKVYNYKIFAGEQQKKEKKNKAPEKEAQCDELPDCQASAKKAVFTWQFYLR